MSVEAVTVSSRPQMTRNKAVTKLVLPGDRLSQESVRSFNPSFAAKEKVLKTNALEGDARALRFSAKMVRRTVAAALGGAVLFSISPPGAKTAAAQCRAAWSEVATPPGSNSFYGVGAVGQEDVWAVGSRYDGVNDRPLAEHFDGQEWTIVPTPVLGIGGAYLRGVGGSSSADVWAVGYCSNGSPEDPD